MYLQNKYTRWYYNIINRAQTRIVEDYTEKHHIIPRSLGGSNSKDNLVRLTAREHYICHLLLVKMVEGQNKSKMARAAAWFKKHDGMINSHIYENLKNLIASDQSLKMKGKTPWNKGLSGLTQSEEAKSQRKKNWEVRKKEGYDFSKMSGKGTKRPCTKSRAENVSRSLKGKPKSLEHIQKIKESKKTISAETREKMRLSALMRHKKALASEDV